MGEEAKGKIKELVERFHRNIDAYKTGSYNETQLRREFIDPFFESLGWDVANRAGYAEQYKDVVHEDSIKVGISLKAPDYSFRIGGQRKFFLEAKKPSVNIKDDINPAYQLRRYAWSAKLPLSILTDFEEFAIYDCRIKPNLNDKVNTGRIAYYTYKQYMDKFDEIYNIFSREAVLRGSFDRYVESSKGKRGTGEVDREFLKEIESWRESLAKNLALRNPGITVSELNFAVQYTIDRIIFLRICEDRGIENYGTLQALQNGVNIYRRLLHHFNQAEIKYNSGLFDFKTDSLSHTLNIDDKVLKGIIENLYYPKSPYEFSVISVDILGNVYEQFLGKVIRLTPGHKAKVEEKPEVKKSGGVYYTPHYIVEYIVMNTVGKLLDTRKKNHKLTPKQVANLKILDPACGSGSFLISAFQYLLDWHIKWYRENQPEKYARGKNPAIYQGAGGEWRLTTQEKKRILLNNIFGVDIDRQAVEVTKLSLLLKVLEDESQETIGSTLYLFQERVLPNLKDNIKCGNSLIGPDFYEQTELNLDDDEIIRVNVFDWMKEFPRIFCNPPGDKGVSGFDVVIGNPPYVRQEMLGDFKPYLQNHYKTYHGMADIYVYFIERGVSLLREGGLFSFIVANKWMRASYGEPLRRWMKGQNIEEIIDFGDLPVFRGATTYPCILRIGKTKLKYASTFHATKVNTLNFVNLQDYVNKYRYNVSRPMLDDNGWSLTDITEQRLLAKIKSAGIPLGEYVKGKIYYGIKTGLNEAFVIDTATKRNLIAEDPKSKDVIKPFLVGKDIKRYSISNEGRYVILIPKSWTKQKSGNVRDGWKWFKQTYPAIAEYLIPFKDKAEKRYDKGEYWWELRACDYYEEFEKPKIIFPDISTKGNFALDTKNCYTVNTTYIIPVSDLYLLGLLNSTLITFYYSRVASTIRGGYLRFIYQYVSELPICIVNFNNPEEKARHGKIVDLVKRMLELHNKLQKAKISHEKELIERQIKMTDSQIDQIIYELYGLTDEEITIIEKEV